MRSVLGRAVTVLVTLALAIVALQPGQPSRVLAATAPTLTKTACVVTTPTTTAATSGCGSSITGAAGNYVQYQLTYTNPNAGTALTIADTLSGGQAFVSCGVAAGTTPTPTCAYNGTNTVTIAFPAGAPATGTAIVTVRLNTALATCPTGSTLTGTNCIDGAATCPAAPTGSTAIGASATIASTCVYSYAATPTTAQTAACTASGGQIINLSGTSYCVYVPQQCSMAGFTPSSSFAATGAALATCSEPISTGFASAGNSATATSAGLTSTVVTTAVALATTPPTIAKTVACTGAATSSTSTNATVALATGGSTICTYTITVTGTAATGTTATALSATDTNLITTTNTTGAVSLTGTCNTAASGTCTAIYARTFTCASPATNTNTASLFEAGVTGAVGTATATVNISCATPAAITKTVSCTGTGVTGNGTASVGLPLAANTGSSVCTYSVTVSGTVTGCVTIVDPVGSQTFTLGTVCAPGTTGAPTGAVTTLPHTFMFSTNVGPFTTCGTGTLTNTADIVNSASMALASATATVTVTVTGCTGGTTGGVVPTVVCGAFAPITGTTTSIMIGTTTFQIPGGLASFGVTLTTGTVYCFLVLQNTVVGILTTIPTSAHQVHYHYHIAHVTAARAMHLARLLEVLSSR